MMLRFAGLLALVAGSATAQMDASFLKALSDKKARSLLADARINGRVGSAWDFRVTSTDKSFNYKLRAIFITPKVSAALARVLITNKGLSEKDALAMTEPLVTDHFYLLVELDPREGSGVIPKEWTARLGLEDQTDNGVVCQLIPDTEPWSTILRAFPRDFAYDAFLVRTPRTVASNSWLESSSPVELKVQIREKTGRVRWSPQQIGK